MYHTFNDQTVPVEQALRFYEALVKAGVPSEMHIFANGPHGTGLGKGDRGSGPVARPAGELAARAGAADGGQGRGGGQAVKSSSQLLAFSFQLVLEERAEECE